MGEACNYRFGDAVAEIVRIRISTQVGEGQHRNRINPDCPSRSHVHCATDRQSDEGDAGGEDNPELATFERLFMRGWYGNCSAGLCIAFQPLQIGTYVRRVLVAKLPIFLYGLVDDTFQLCRKIGIQTHRRDRKSTRLNSSHQIISYAVFCLKKKK